MNVKNVKVFSLVVLIAACSVAPAVYATVINSGDDMIGKLGASTRAQMSLPVWNNLPAPNLAWVPNQSSVQSGAAAGTGIGHLIVDGSGASGEAGMLAACISDPRGKELAFVQEREGLPDVTLSVVIKDGLGTELTLEENPEANACFPLSNIKKGLVVFSAKGEIGAAGLYNSVADVRLMAP